MYPTIQAVLKDYDRNDIVLVEHVADSHLGYNGRPSKYNEFKPLRVEKTIGGHNVRTLDVNEAFRQTIDIALDYKVDIYLNAGDGFDTYGYRHNFIENFYTKQYLRLTETSIPIVEIVGNHNLPLQEGVGCHLERIGLHDDIYAVYKGKYERVAFDDLNVTVHCAPSSFTQEALDEALEQVKKEEGRINIGLGHFGVSNIEHYVQSADNSLVVDLDRLIACEMDYFALGDYHAATDLGHNIHYAGAGERLGFGEIDNKPQVKLAAFDKKTGTCICVESIYLDVRRMEKLVLDASGKTIDVINEEIIKLLSSDDFTDAILLLKILHLPVEMKQLLCHQDMATLVKDCLAFKLRIEKVDTLQDVRSGKTTGLSVVEGFRLFADKLPKDGSFDPIRLLEEGEQLLKEVLADEN